MKYNKSKSIVAISKGQWMKCLFSLTAIAVITACDVSSTSVTDTDLVATFLVQNDNGQASATATFTSSDPAGDNTVDLVAGESIWYQNNDVSNELRKRADGEYSAVLATTAAGWYSFNLKRQSEDRELFTREVNENYVYLPDPIQSVQAEPLQFGSVINLSWAQADNALQSINGFTAERSEDTFNAIATCQLEDESISLAITEGQTAQQDGIVLLEIPVTENLLQVPGLTAASIATLQCEFDVQLVRTMIGVTDVSLNRKSSASGQVLQNITIQWVGQ